MSNLYAKVFTDMRKEPATARGKSCIEVYLHYNKDNYDDKIMVSMTKYENGKIVISAWVPTKDGSNGEVRILQLEANNEDK